MKDEKPKAFPAVESLSDPESLRSGVTGFEVLMAFFLFFLLSFIAANLSRWLFAGNDASKHPWQLAALQIPVHLFLAFSILWLRRFHGGTGSQKALGWTQVPSPLKGILKGMLWYLPMGFSWWTLAFLYSLGLKALGLGPPKQEVLQFFLKSGIPPYGMVLLWITTCVTAPLAEELLFRGSLFSWLRGKLSFWPAALITALAFSFPHGGWKFVIPLGYLALMLAWLREQSGSIWEPVGLHAMHNATTLLLVTLVKTQL